MHDLSRIVYSIFMCTSSILFVLFGRDQSQHDENRLRERCVYFSTLIAISTPRCGINLINLWRIPLAADVIQSSQQSLVYALLVARYFIGCPKSKSLTLNQIGSGNAWAARNYFWNLRFSSGISTANDEKGEAIQCDQWSEIFSVEISILNEIPYRI